MNTKYLIKDNVKKVFTNAENQIGKSLPDIFQQKAKDFYTHESFNKYLKHREHLEDCTDIRNNYMYMYSDSDYDYFKCINHREYLKVTSN